MAKKPNIAFLGAGNMGSALIHGALNAKIVSAGQIRVCDADQSKLNSWKKQSSLKIAKSNPEAVEGSDYIFLCVKPQQMTELIGEIKNAVTSKQCLISIAAGVPAKKIENQFSIDVPLIRVMPNTPALIRSGMTALTKGRFALDAQLQFAKNFFEAVGKTVVLPEEHFDAVTAVSGSGPAYLFYLAESLERAAEKLGLPSSVAQALSKQTIAGAAKLLDDSADSPAELRRKVTSPGGTTEAAVNFLQEKQWSEIFAQAVEKARDRSIELSHR